MREPSKKRTLPGENIKIPCLNMSEPGKNMKLPCPKMRLPRLNMKLPCYNIRLPWLNTTLPCPNIQFSDFSEVVLGCFGGFCQFLSFFGEKASPLNPLQRRGGG
jgi:hypothetical protein